MSLKKVVVYSSKEQVFDKKICGLYPLERILYVLDRSGVESVSLNLNRDELSHFEKKIRPYISRIKNLRINITEKPASGAVKIQSSLFTQKKYFDSFTKYFKKKGADYIPVLNSDQFELKTKSDFERARDILVDQIINSEGKGWIARKINKRISIPVSLLLSNTRVTPNFLTFVNFFIALLSAYLITINEYPYVAFGGFLFQMVSVFDGVDGELARFTFRTSKIGAILDTVLDNLAFFIFIAAAAYLTFQNFDRTTSIALIVLLSVCAIQAAGIIISFYWILRGKHVSLLEYEIRFINRLPADDMEGLFIRKLKFFFKKEFYSITFFIMCVSGAGFLIVPALIIVMMSGATHMIILQFRYLKKLMDSYGK